MVELVLPRLMGFYHDWTSISREDGTIDYSQPAWKNHESRKLRFTSHNSLSDN